MLDTQIETKKKQMHHKQTGWKKRAKILQALNWFSALIFEVCVGTERLAYNRGVKWISIKSKLHTLFERFVLEYSLVWR